MEGAVKEERVPQPGILCWLRSLLEHTGIWSGLEFAQEEGMGAARQCTGGLAQTVPASSLHFPAHEAFLLVDAVGRQQNSCFSGRTQLEALVWLCGESLDYSLCCNYGCIQDGGRVCHSSSLSACLWWDTVRHAGLWDHVCPRAGQMS